MEAKEKLQKALNEVNAWTNNGTSNTTKHSQDTLTLLIDELIILNKNVMPYTNTAKYLDTKLTWKEHIQKEKELNFKYRKMYGYSEEVPNCQHKTK